MRPLRRTFVLAALAALLAMGAGCSPQRRLARIVAQHPELRADTLVRVPVRVVLPAAGASVLLDLPEPPTDTASARPQRRSAADIKTGASVTAGRARASVIPTDSGLLLVAEQLPDTLTDTASVLVPRLTTGTAPAREKPAAAFLRHVGLLAIIAACLWVGWSVMKN